MGFVRQDILGVRTMVTSKRGPASSHKKGMGKSGKSAYRLGSLEAIQAYY
jgi:hypothetical protein